MSKHENIRIEKAKENSVEGNQQSAFQENSTLGNLKLVRTPVNVLLRGF